ncbi:MAG: filamentous hemagglutinin N-terminal domain-containing protein [Thermodesulfobacteriota bacterium]|nr:filamentous hemagglutinin N-terminal domain-containing protein [Thermodesulfobacteriota bacterium]
MKIAKRFFYTITVISFFMYISSSPLMALEPGEFPAGGQIVAGSGGISSTGSQMTVTQNTEKMIVDWSTFNIGANAGVQFVQPSATSAALNRIHDTSPSQIFGQLNANGQVFLLNSAGIIFGPTAQVNVGALVASSLNITNEDFMAGNLAFEAGDMAGPVLNQGHIEVANGMYVALLSPDVRNEGTITAQGGSVLMAAADKVNLDFTGDGLINYVVDKGAMDALAENNGLIKADGGVVVMTARAAHDLTTAVVNNEGIIEAHTLQEKNGRILLLSDMKNGETIVGGRLDASAPDGGDGGFIETSANKVSYLDGFIVTAEAPFGKGGLWLIDPASIDINQAIADGYVTTLDAGTSVLAEADAGDVTMNSDVVIAKTAGGDATLTLKATGNVILESGITTISSDTGKLSVILWSDSDASNNGRVYLSSGSSISTNGGDITMGGGADPSTGYAVGDGAFVLVGDEERYYYAGVELAGSTIASNGGAIIMNGKSCDASGADLTYHNWVPGVRISGSGDINSGTGKISINGAGVAADNILVYLMGVWVQDTSTISSSNTDSDAISITGTGTTGDTSTQDVKTLYGVFLDADIRSLAESGGGIEIDGTIDGDSLWEPFAVGLIGNYLSKDGTIYITGDSDDATGTGSESACDFRLGRDVEDVVYIGQRSETSVDDSSADITLDVNTMDIDSASTSSLESSGTLTIQPRTAATTIGIADGAGTLAITADNFATNFVDGFEGGITVGNSTAGTITVGGATTFNDNTTLETGSTIAIDGTVTTAADTNLALTSAGAIAQSAALTVPGTTTITAGAGNNITLSNANNNFTGAVSVVSGNNVSLRDVGAMELGASTVSGTLTLQTAGALTQSGALAVTGTTGITAGANDATLTNTGNDFGGVVTVVSVKDLGLINSDAMSLGAVTSTGTVDVVTLTNDITLTGAISTNNTTTNAVKLNAGRSTEAGTATGGNIIINGGTVTVGAGGRGTFYTGGVTGSTGLTDYIVSESGRFRYNSDEITTSYITALGAGNYAIYREEPTTTVTAKDQTYDYVGVPYSGGNGVTTSGFVNGDTADITFGGTLAYLGTSQGALKEGTYTITPEGYTSLLGYAISYVNGVLTINRGTVPSGVTSSKFKKVNDVVESLYNTISSLCSVQWSVNGTQDGRLLCDTEQFDDSTNYMYDLGPMSGSGSVEAVSSSQLIIDRAHNALVH